MNSSARNPSLHRLISLTHQHRPPSATTLITTADTNHDSALAQQTSWDLLGRGLAHLADGGINGANGMLTTAISRASLRSAPVASALGIAAPMFKLTVTVTPCHDTHAQAVFLARRMTEAVLADIDTSALLIERALRADKMIDTGTRDYFNQLVDVHQRQCETLLVMIDRLPPPPVPGKTPVP